MRTPYSHQQRHHFWMNIVEDKGGDIDLSHIYEKKFDLGLGQGAKVATAGSCFARNIRPHLLGRNCNFLDTEASPLMLPEPLRRQFGFDLFSARYGNIYTSGQLRQLAERAFGKFVSREYWEKDGRFYDPFRPTIEPNGFETPEELEKSRECHLAAVRRLFTEMDVFIFTLGISEAWVSAEDGAVYTVCPGTIAGEFDPETHKLVNYRTADVVRDFEVFRDLVRSVNPDVKFILTVSPGAISATATPLHAANANSYTKAVLRSAAGELYELHEDVDYFPSYEIFTSPAFPGRFFEDDMRTAAPDGVTRVMEVFFAVHGEGPMPDGSKPTLTPAEREMEIFLARQQEICDDLILEAEYAE